MVERAVTILGGLPVIAEVSFGYDSGSPYNPPEHWADVTALYWQRRDGTKGKEVSQHVYDRLRKYDEYWQCGVIEQVSDQLGYEASQERKEQANASILRL